ncbi:hypothetical protein F5883DRAFT_668197 [Diaporthe sp. PMI_573]|nr:hypothetical protein F5883DRAFT_668197 [Diaporthaceae sp. PMI_573]
MMCTLDKRPQHALYEGTAPMPLCFNPMLPFLARLLAYRAFRDYYAIDGLLKIMPPEGEMMVIEWKEELLETPFFRSQSNDEIETVGAFSHRLRLLEGLYLMSLMVYAGHTDPNTVPRHYLPRNGVDGQAAYYSQERRALFECENCLDIIHINEALFTRRGKTDSKSLEERKKLYAEKRKLFARQLRDWQKRQLVKHDDPPGYHRAIFDRVRFLMPERDRLARNIFEVNILRSSTGLAVLNDVLALYQKSSNVECRPGLELDKCQCGKGNDWPYEWRHVYECYKAAASNVHGFSELCFLCNVWFHGAEGWERHCRHHLDHPDDLPIWCDPLTYGGVLARAGYCPFCLGDERLLAQVRMHQFKIRWTWLDHIQTHIRALQDGLEPVSCPRLHPSCPGEFETITHSQKGRERDDAAAPLKKTISWLSCRLNTFSPTPVWTA